MKYGAALKLRKAVKGLELNKDDGIEAVLYRHTWDETLQSGEVQTHTRHNLARISKVDRKEGAKRSKKEQDRKKE